MFDGFRLSLFLRWECINCSVIVRTIGRKEENGPLSKDGYKLRTIVKTRVEMWERSASGKNNAVRTFGTWRSQDLGESNQKQPSCTD